MMARQAFNLTNSTNAPGRRRRLRPSGVFLRSVPVGDDRRQALTVPMHYNKFRDSLESSNPEPAATVQPQRNASATDETLGASVSSAWVDLVQRRLPCADAPDAFSNVASRLFGNGDASQMRRDQHIVHRPEWVITRQRLDREHIERRTAQMPGSQRLDQGGFVNHFTARNIDETSACRQGLEHLRPNHASGERRQRQHVHEDLGFG